MTFRNAIGHRRAVQHADPPDPATAVALAWQPARTRAALAALFALDRRLAGVVARVREPILAQMRFAWWRERLTEPVAQRPAGEPLLGDLAEHWGETSSHLVPLIDGWEASLGEAPLPIAALQEFAAGRGAAFAAFASLAGVPDPAEETACRAAGVRWAYAELACRTSTPAEAAQARQLGNSETGARMASAEVRGLAVLDELSRRSLTRGEPLMHGRRAALAALRVGMFGR
ncbi:squalene/phytoene synthase family protein [Parafrankia sp. BMG5.11]|uniref:squalene/phytoene synthase family protein n=1 Tax=Parafrankia sp. BMG5.11 TaxID=222540 RepID=UPI001040A29F|nr:squalene/phytoene synthase family protein [Parafrankia sp. BMG5.11]